MIDAIGNDRIASMLVSFLDVQSQRAQVASSNIANADTPGYTAKGLEFADYLRQTAFDAVAPNARPALLKLGADQPALVELGGQSGIDGNTVDMAHEMSQLGDAGMKYLAGVTLLQSRLRLLSTAIKEGK